ncbi:four-carbon acid sugar kinase family protein [Marinovum sp. 2_MG-2023]|uniref:four-carbon acid sugar kinase family protein n=1 Tax=Roseobacteraceae TaxID=2854170 RepID=UPI001FD273AA|nr:MULTISPECIES: four-carbon acid sugar kinase family protein [Roseobacteraceae]MCJ7872545.1 four-carbon acid sugar kinase family protein [Phaeobacter sp. J2-8]MDO6730224.1 four-carbon acid sugar kinase family protein [Marinovum sp. 2_MG-2023]MDO6778962.1 four-carbon acid sugar kinase family protein [Marinovum sp. 1_MG-2023]
MTTVLGCIADDFTGATDLAGLLARSGVPWTYCQSGGQQIALTLKSGNFGSETFFTDAQERLAS